MFNKFIYKTYRDFTKYIKSIKATRPLDQLFYLFLILIFAFIIVNNFGKNLGTLENYDNFYKDELSRKNFFDIKRQNNVYDDFYTKYYDSIHLNKKKNDYEIGKITNLERKNNNTKILDVGCGTGYHVNKLTKQNYDVIGLDYSKAMIKKARDNYPDSEFKKGDILNNNLFDYNTFTHILCLDRTLYLIKDKEKFLENCYSLLTDGGYLILNLVDKNKFRLYTNKNDNKTVFNPENYGKKIDQVIIKFNKNTEFISMYKKNDDIKNKNHPFITIQEKFQNYDTNAIRKNEIDLFIPQLNEIINLAKAKGFNVYKKFDLRFIDYNNEYLYVFKK